MTGNSKKNWAALCPRARNFLLFSVSMLFVMSVHAQSLTLNVKNASLSSIFKEIRQQSGYDFFYNKELIAKCNPVTLQVKNASIENVLNQCFRDQPLTYKIENRTVMIREKEAARNVAQQPAIDLEGRVVDSTGMPLIGASVRVKATKISTVTDVNGRFRLSGVGSGDRMDFSYVGFMSREIMAENANNNIIVLKNDINKLHEVAVVSTGYQTISKERSAGAFATADMNIVANRSTSMNVLQSLDGQIPGMVVNNAPNRNQFVIRGMSTTGAPALNGQAVYGGTSREPLYVVDGLVIQDVSSINPQDVLSVTVLKDATAASIWGARAANGVIVINTKKGAFNSKLRVHYDGFVNFKGKPDLDYVKRLNSRQFIDAGKEVFYSPGYLQEYAWPVVSVSNSTGIAPHELILYNLSRGLITQQQADYSLDSLAAIDNHGQISNLVYRNAILSNHTVSLSGGGEQYSFYGSASYTGNTSELPGEKNNTYKINFRQDIKPAKFLSIHFITDVSNNVSSAKRNVNLDYSFYPYQLLRGADGQNLSVPFMKYQSDSTRKDYEARSRISLDYNPLDEFNYGYTKSDALTARFNSGINIEFVKGLKFEGNYGYIKGNAKTRDLESLQSYAVRKEIVNFTVAPNASTVPKYYLPANGGKLTSNVSDVRNWTVRNQLTYDKTWNVHALTLLAGQEAQEQFSTTQRTTVRGFDEDLQTSVAVDYITLSGLLQNTVYPTLGNVGSQLAPDAFATNETTSRFRSYYANAAYTYDRRYTINGSWRNDQSNLFGKSKAAQSKPAWSAGVKWVATNEIFMEPVSWLELLDLRVTYGLTGNSPSPGVAASEDIITPLGNTFFPGGVGMKIATPGNDQLSWESTATTNVGIDFSIFDSRIYGYTDVYVKKTSNLLGLIYPNSLNGWPAIVGNQGGITNKGIEVNLQTVNVRTRKFSWTTSWIFTYNKNKVDKLTVAVPFTTGAQQINTYLKEGLPAYALFAYNYAGLDAEGITQVRLADGKISNDRSITKPEDVLYAGSLQPIWNGGIGNNFRYGNFSLAANIVYNMGHVMRRDRRLLYGGPLHSNVSVDFLNRWKNPGDEKITDIPGYVSNGSPIAGRTNTDYFRFGNVNVVDASFVKLRDITLFYDIPGQLLQRANIQGLTFRVQVSNVMLWKGNNVGIDPEFIDAMNPTNQKTFTIGAHLKL